MVGCNKLWVVNMLTRPKWFLWISFRKWTISRQSFSEKETDPCMEQVFPLKATLYSCRKFYQEMQAEM
jgi:hypothetical protein